MLVIVPLNSILFNHMKSAEDVGLKAYHIDQAGRVWHLVNGREEQTVIGKLTTYD